MRDLAERPDGIHPDMPLMVRAPRASAMSGIPLRTWWLLHSRSLVPEPVKVGRGTYWRTADLVSWVERGCPGLGRAR
jgi:predicted DNA-binding transcriptional regulator AlpA